MKTKRLLIIVLITMLIWPVVDAATGHMAGLPSASAQVPTGGLQKYGDVITSDAESKTGVFTVHKVGKKFYLEIPAAALGKEMLWYAEIAEFPTLLNIGLKGNALGSRVVRWERRGNQLLVRDLTNPLTKRAALPGRPEDQPTSDEKVAPVEMAVATSSLPPITLAFDVVTEGPGGSAVIDVSDVFASDLPDFSLKEKLTTGGYPVAAGVDPKRSYIEGIKTFPGNIEVSTLLTFPVSNGPASAVSTVIHHSLTMLPDNRMMPRYADPRVGYFTTAFTDYSQAQSHWVTQRELIRRYRLEKKDPNAELSEPVKPIVYYIGRGVPDRWRPYFKQAVEDWNVAFEAAGFKNAIIAKDAPTEAEDPNWDPADTSYSVIRWLAQDVENAMGPNIVDPRTGEILSAHVLIWANVVKVAETWYLLQASANDPRARTLPLPDDIVGQIMRYIVSHEVGHSLGLRHNHRASQAFTVEQLRDPAFTDQYGSVASIMSYGRFNYVAQPGDGVKRLIPKIGPYDLFAINWGYGQIPGVKSPADETGTLRSWAAEQAKNPWLGFGGENIAAFVDPGVLTENIGADRIESTRLGLANLERVMSYLVPATTRPGESNDTLAQMYKAAVGQRETWLKSVIKMIGGVEESRTLGGGDSPQFERVPGTKQQAAAKFVVDSLRTQPAFLRRDVVALTRPIMALDPLQSSQKKILAALLTGQIYEQLNDQAALQPEDAYPLQQYLADIRDGLWEELAAQAPQIDPMRRDLQRTYLKLIAQQLAPESTEAAKAAAIAEGSDPDLVAFSLAQGEDTDFHAAARATLREFLPRLQAAIQATTDAATRVHLEDSQDQVKAMLAL